MTLSTKYLSPRGNRGHLTPGAEGVGDRTLDLGMGALDTSSVSVTNSFSKIDSPSGISGSVC